mgnify:CR=1 FL=1
MLVHTPKGGGGLYVSVHPAHGEPVLPPRFVDADGWEGDVDVPGSGDSPALNVPHRFR